MERSREAREARFSSGEARAFEISDWADELWDEADRAQAARRSGTTLVKTSEMRVVLQVMGKGAVLQEHTAPGVLTLQVLEGDLSVQAGGSEHRMRPGMLLYLPPFMPHAVEARRDSVFLLSIGLAERAPKRPAVITTSAPSFPASEPEQVGSEEAEAEGATVVRWQSPLEQLTAADIMSPDIVTVSADTSLEAVARQFAALSISAAPVLDEAGELIGLVSESDLIDEERRRVTLPPTVVYGEGELLEDAARALYADGNVRTVREVMTTPVFTLSADTPARVVATEMVDRKINHVPILQDGRLVGIVARADVLRALTGRP